MVGLAASAPSGPSSTDARPPPDPPARRRSSDRRPSSSRSSRSGRPARARAATVVLQPVVSGLVATRSSSRAPGDGTRPPVRRRAGRQDPDRQERRPAADPLPRHLGHGRLRRRAGAARARVPPELQDQRRASTSTAPSRAAIWRSTQYQGLLDEPGRGRPDQLAAAPDHPPARTRNHNGGMLAFGNRRLPVHRHRRRRRRRRPGQQRPERQRAARQDPADRRQRHDRRHPATGSRATTRTSAGPVATRSGRAACATRGASRSTAPPATCGSATSARTSYEEIDRSTSTSAGHGRGINYGWRVMEGRHCYNPSTGCNTSGKTLPVVEYTPRRRAAR